MQLYKTPFSRAYWRGLPLTSRIMLPCAEPKLSRLMLPYCSSKPG